MTRDEMNARVLAVVDKEFIDEVEYFMSVDDREYDYDPVCAALDIMDRSEENRNRRLLTVARRVLIDLGFFRIMSEEEAENTITSSGRAPWEFKIAGVMYVSEGNVEEWMEC